MDDNTIHFPAPVAPADGGPARSDVSYQDNIITGITWGAGKTITGRYEHPEPDSEPEPDLPDSLMVDEVPTPVPATADQTKAINCILSGMPFVFIAISPTPRGASFYRAIHGDPGDLRNALDSVHEQVDKAYYAKGILK